MNERKATNEESFESINRENNNPTTICPKDALLFARIFARKFEKTVPYIQMKFNPGKEPSKPYQYRVAILPPDGALPNFSYDYNDEKPGNLLDLYEEFLFCLPR